MSGPVRELGQHIFKSRIVGRGVKTDAIAKLKGLAYEPEQLVAKLIDNMLSDSRGKSKYRTDAFLNLFAKLCREEGEVDFKSAFLKTDTNRLLDLEDTLGEKKFNVIKELFAPEIELAFDQAKEVRLQPGVGRQACAFKSLSEDGGSEANSFKSKPARWLSAFNNFKGESDVDAVSENSLLIDDSGVSTPFTGVNVTQDKGNHALSPLPAGGYVIYPTEDGNDWLLGAKSPDGKAVRSFPVDKKDGHWMVLGQNLSAFFPTFEEIEGEYVVTQKSPMVPQRADYTFYVFSNQNLSPIYSLDPNEVADNSPKTPSFKVDYKLGQQFRDTKSFNSIFEALCFSEKLNLAVSVKMPPEIFQSFYTASPVDHQLSSSYQFLIRPAQGDRVGYTVVYALDGKTLKQPCNTLEEACFFAKRLIAAQKCKLPPNYFKYFQNVTESDAKSAGFFSSIKEKFVFLPSDSEDGKVLFYFESQNESVKQVPLKWDAGFLQVDVASTEKSPLDTLFIHIDGNNVVDCRGNRTAIPIQTDCGELSQNECVIFNKNGSIVVAYPEAELQVIDGKVSWTTQDNNIVSMTVGDFLRTYRMDLCEWRPTVPAKQGRSNTYSEASTNPPPPLPPKPPK